MILRNCGLWTHKAEKCIICGNIIHEWDIGVPQTAGFAHEHCHDESISRQITALNRNMFAGDNDSERSDDG